jgi:hypothetical protein
MARFLDRVILFVVSWWSNNQDPQQNENNEARGEARRRGSTSTVVPAGSCHIMSASGVATLGLAGAAAPARFALI